MLQGPCFNALRSNIIILHALKREDVVGLADFRSREGLDMAVTLLWVHESMPVADVFGGRKTRDTELDGLICCRFTLETFDIAKII